MAYGSGATLRRTAAAGYKVHHQRDHRKDQKNVDEEAADVKHEKAAEPKENQNDRKD
jgi:hypothetical protein